MPPYITNIKNLELASPQSVTATRLDQLVYTPRSDLKVKNISVWEQDNVELISIEIHVVVAHCVYKPPNDTIVLPD